MIIDSHCHLNYPELHTNLPDVLERAKAHGVGMMLTINTRIEEAGDLKDIAEAHDNIYYSVGIHPHHAKEYDLVKLSNQLDDLVQHSKVLGLGETGLDFYYNHSDRDSQIQSFRIHMEAAKKHNLPLIIHTRDADDDTIEILEQAAAQGVGGVLHCFTGTKRLAEAGLKNGFYISVSGIMTFKKAAELRDVIKEVPLDRLLVETDSPYLAPEPYRGKPNEPAYTKYVVESLAILKETDIKTIEQQTTENFFTLFNKAKKPS